MNRRLTLVFFVSTLCLPLIIADEPPAVAPTEAKTPEEEKKCFKLPPGFEAQLVACEPDIAKPMNIAFDSKGRLWVTSSLEYPFPAQGRPGRDMVSILEDFAPDGKARKISTYAKDLNIPIGLLPRSDGALVYSINSLDKLEGPITSLYQKRTKLYEGFGFRDTHGMINSFTQGYDGWIYACHGYANDSTTKGSDGQELKMNSGNVFRFKPDGSHVEIFTRGQVNPFGLCFDPHGNLYSADCHTKPMTQLIRGAHYDSFGKPHDGLGYGPNMMGHLHDSTGLCGIVYYDADAYPAKYKDTMFVCNVVTCKLNHDKIVFKGSTPEAVLQPDFMSSDDPWYRPVYLAIGPDGNIYLSDFYNKIIGHYEVPLSHPGRDRTRGRIWRIVYKGNDAKATPAPHGGDLTKCTIEELLKAFEHPNIAVRLMALQEAVERNLDTLSVLEDAGPEHANPNRYALQLWALERIGAGRIKRDLIKACESGAPLVQEHALKIISNRDSWVKTIEKAATDLLTSKDTAVQRKAAEAQCYNRNVTRESIRTLNNFLLSTEKVDTHLQHTLRIALRNQLARLPFSELLAMTPAEIEQLADISLGIADVQGGEAAMRAIQLIPGWKSNLPKFVQHASRYLPQQMPTIHELLQKHRTHHHHYAALLQAEVQGLREAGEPLPSDIKADAKSFAHDLCTNTDPAMVQLGIDLCSQAKLTDQFDTVAAVVKNTKVPEPQRTAAVNALPSIDAGKAESLLLGYILQHDLPDETRERAAIIAGGSNKPAMRAQLFETIKVVPSKIANVIAYTIANNPGGADELMKAVEAGKIPPSILLTTSVQSRINNHNRKEFRERYAKLTAGLPPADVKLAELVALRGSKFKADQANAENGSKVFKQHCAICHQLNNEGAKIGPQLDGVGIRGVERLLEDILDPNRNVDQAFRATIVVLKDGRTLTGLVLREEGNLVVLADLQGKEQKFDKNDIDERKVSNLSPMPATMDTQIKESELNDLIKYLLSQQAKK
ncbi:MAG TPA: c-type cytochrome [Gemmatales bacterium]|nr:c-type cytochrome [Gemmatales bacterium]